MAEWRHCNYDALARITGDWFLHTKNHRLRISRRHDVFLTVGAYGFPRHFRGGFGGTVRSAETVFRRDSDLMVGVCHFVRTNLR